MVSQIVWWKQIQLMIIRVGRLVLHGLGKDSSQDTAFELVFKWIIILTTIISVRESTAI